MTTPFPHLPPETEADLVALADGRLHADRRAEVQARVAADPVLAAELATQRAALGALAAALVTAPDHLHEQLRADGG
jgi:anti-sigma factor RsiW